MPLNQMAVDRLAQVGLMMFDTLAEPITFFAKAFALDTAITYDVVGHFEQYTDHIIAMHQVAADRPLVLRADQRVRVPTAMVTWQPTIYNEIARARGGGRWRVISFESGINYPWWIFQVREVPPLP